MAANHHDDSYPAGSPRTLEDFKRTLADKRISLATPAPRPR
jgi:hypothetical protein